MTSAYRRGHDASLLLFGPVSPCGLVPNDGLMKVGEACAASWLLDELASNSASHVYVCSFAN